MRKLITVLERDPTRAKSMAEWLEDRLYMYESPIESTPDGLIRSIRERLNDVLVLCLGRESLGTKSVISDFLLSRPERFPILIHSGGDSGPDELSLRLVQKGWTIKSIEERGCADWIGVKWYPALMRILSDIAASNPVMVCGEPEPGRLVR